MEVKKYNPIGFLSNFSLKIIAAMTIDHIGYMFFPEVMIFRIIGRIAFPLFAFLIAEGCSYTKNKLKRFLTMLIVGIVYFIAYYIYTKELYGSIFMTFTFSIFFIFLLYDIKKMFVNKKYLISILLCLLFGCSLYLSYLLFNLIHIDYTFYGMLVPVFISLFDFRNLDVPKFLKKLDCLWIKLLCLALALFILCIYFKLLNVQQYCMLSLVFILFYNGKLGIKGTKYGFYIYYPVHMLLLEGLNYII